MKSIKFTRSSLFLFIIILSSCASYKPFYSSRVNSWQDETPTGTSEPVYSVFLLGDSRLAYTDETLLSMMKSHLTEAEENSAVLFLGDNVQPNGLPDSTHRNWDVAHESLMAQLDILESYKGEIIFIPGNHDWARGKKEGLDYVKNQSLLDC